MGCRTGSEDEERRIVRLETRSGRWSEEGGDGAGQRIKKRTKRATSWNERMKIILDK